MLKVTIDRKQWLRGEGSAGSYLFRVADEKMCCLGFVALAKGCTVADLKSKKIVLERNPLANKIYNVLPGFTENDIPWLDEAYTINDDRSTTDEEKERLLTVEFAKGGIEAEFVG